MFQLIAIKKNNNFFKAVTDSNAMSYKHSLFQQSF